MEDYILFKSKYKEVKKSSKLAGTTIFLSLALVTRIILLFFSSNASLVEKLYSSTIYPYIAKCVGFISSAVPFSIAEALLLLAALFVIILFFYIIINPNIIFNNIQSILHYLIRGLALAYILFYFLWGFNYYREDYSVLDNMNGEPATYDDLRELTLEKIGKVNAIRELLEEDEKGLFFIHETIDELGKIANIGFHDYQVGNLSLDGKYGRIKPVFLSKYMSFTGITGIFIPFTSEPTVNIDVPYQNLLSTITHEIAHQRGFAKEDEANFISYKANINNPDERFQYSGYYLAMTHLINEVYRQNRDDYPLLYNKISDSVKRDLDFAREYWTSKEGKVREKANKMNDNYLKANNQVEGVKSYSGVVKLLLAEYKSR